MKKELIGKYSHHDYFEFILRDDDNNCDENYNMILSNIKEAIKAINILNGKIFSITIYKGYTENFSFDEQEILLKNNKIIFKDSSKEKLISCKKVSIKFE